ncbi:MAG: dinitrogenase iron-molybdenum cofactor biosynthesis protein [Desulfamplus sp.]|nr:dinitrogenase iron-molybdenum cofactor biosynthesis protein [Desulfamplus sp.]
MIKKILIPISGDDVAPRFDLAKEVVIIFLSGNNMIEEQRTFVLQETSAEKLCHFILKENIHILICGAIEEEFYQFLKWKKVTMYDFVISTWERAFKCCIEGSLKPGAILYERHLRDGLYDKDDGNKKLRNMIN